MSWSRPNHGSGINAIRGRNPARASIETDVNRLFLVVFDQFEVSIRSGIALSRVRSPLEPSVAGQRTTPTDAAIGPQAERTPAEISARAGAKHRGHPGHHPGGVSAAVAR